MIVGLTYDLRADYLAAGYGEEETAEFDRPDTIEAIERALNQLGYRTERIGNVRKLVNELAAGHRWDLVFNIAEGLRGVGRESQVPALLDACEIPYTFSDPVVTGLALHKGLTKHVLRDQGIPTAEFAVVESKADVARVNLPFPLFVKPVAEGTAKGITARSKVKSANELREQCEHLLQRYAQPVLVEAFLSGREVTVGITGTGDEAVAVGTLEITLLAHAEADAYTYVNKEKCEELCRYTLADEALSAQAEELALRTWRGLGCRDGGRVDLRADANGKLRVLEVNPLPGMHPEHSDLPILCTAVGVPYVELIRRIVDSARRRCVGPASCRSD
jgi:D-alanine-D-alanine ligase